MKKSSLSYTLKRKEAQEKKFPIDLGYIHECTIKMPKLEKPSLPKKSSSPPRTPTKLEHSKTPPFAAAGAFEFPDDLGDNKLSLRKSATIYEKGGKRDAYLLRLADSKGKELAQLKSMQLQPLKNLCNQIVSKHTKQTDTKNALGRRKGED